MGITAVPQGGSLEYLPGSLRYFTGVTGVPQHESLEYLMGVHCCTSRGPLENVTGGLNGVPYQGHWNTLWGLTVVPHRITAIPHQGLLWYISAGSLEYFMGFTGVLHWGVTGIPHGVTVAPHWGSLEHLLGGSLEYLKGITVAFTGVHWNASWGSLEYLPRGHCSTSPGRWKKMCPNWVGPGGAALRGRMAPTADTRAKVSGVVARQAACWGCACVCV